MGIRFSGALPNGLAETFMGAIYGFVAVGVSLIVVAFAGQFAIVGFDTRRIKAYRWGLIIILMSVISFGALAFVRGITVDGMIDEHCKGILQVSDDRWLHGTLNCLKYNGSAEVEINGSVHYNDLGVGTTVDCEEDWQEVRTAFFDDTARAILAVPRLRRMP
jgi:hypothetical protein